MTILNMKRYELHIVLMNDNEIHCRVEAMDKNDAMHRLTHNSQFRDFCEGSAIRKVDVTEIPHEEVVDENRFALTMDGDICTAVDLDGRFRVVWRKNCYADNKLYRIGEKLPKKGISASDTASEVLEDATAIRQLGEWLVRYHPELI